MLDTTVFQEWQPIYAEHHIATFPVGQDKRPMVTGYGRFGLAGSAKIATKFGDAPAIGFVGGRRNGVTVLDVDTTDERVLADAVDRHGQTPLIAKTANGKFHGYYRHNGERRRIRPDRNVPIDILGGGLIVAPPSRGSSGAYQFITGGLDDLDRLPVMQNVPVEAWDNCKLIGAVKEGERNRSLFNLCLHAARHCDALEALVDVATTHNREFLPPMKDDEVMRVAASAWRYETEGTNYSGGKRAVFSTADMLPLMADPYVAALTVWAKASFKPGCHFWLADGLAEKFSWSVYELRHARRRAVKMGIFRLVRRAYFKKPAIYTWGLRELRLRESGVC